MSAQNSVPSCLKGQYFGQYFTSENIHREILSLINQLCTCLTTPELCQNCDFYLKKWMEEISAYVLEFMLTSAKMQDDSTLM